MSGVQGALTIGGRGQGGGVLVSVSDTGVGIPADKLRDIFNAFVTTNPGGTGMGAGDRPYHHRGTWRPLVGGGKPARRRGAPRYPADAADDSMITEAPPVVFIVDDDANVRRSIQDLLASVSLRSEAFTTPQEFLEHKRADRPSCLVLDVRVPGMSGLDCQRKLAEAGVTTPIIFITGHGDVPMTVRAMKSGAIEVLTKPFRPQELLDAVQQALDQDRALAAKRRETAEVRKRYETLTAREREVMAMVVAGLLNKQVAAQLGTVEHTVKIHRGHVMTKMMASSLPALTRLADML